MMVMDDVAAVTGGDGETGKVQPSGGVILRSRF